MARNRNKLERDENGFIKLQVIPGSAADRWIKARRREKTKKLPKDSDEMLSIFVDEYGVDAVANMDQVNIGDYVYKKGINYSLNMNVGRNIAWLEDGLKSVERRVLYTMYSKKAYNDHMIKVSSITGSMMETLYPHGDGAASDTIYRLGRSLSTMIPYIVGEGNYGSADDMRPAAPRYASGSLSDYAMDCFFSEMGARHPIFDVKDNYQYTGKEPVYLTSKYPNILMQWNLGIGKGASYMIAGFNSRELMRATIQLMDDPEAKIDIYPDSPVPIDIINKKDLKGCFDMETFKVVMRGQYTFEVDKKRDEHGKVVDKHMIVFTSMPLNVTGKLIENQIKSIKEDDLKLSPGNRKLPEIINIETASNSKHPGGIQIFFEYEKGYDPNALVEKLFRMTSLEKTFGVRNLLIANNKPTMYTPRQILLYWISRRHDNKRRYLHQSALKAAKDRAQYEAMVKILSTPESRRKAINIIESSKNDDESIKGLMKGFDLTEFQASVVLQIRLRTLSKMNVDDVRAKMEQALKDYKYYRKVLTDDKVITGMIREELEKAIVKYGSDRKATLKSRKQNTEHNPDETKVILYNNTTYTCALKGEDLSKMEIPIDSKYLEVKNKTSVVMVARNGSIKFLNGQAFTKTNTGIMMDLNEIVGIIPVTDHTKYIAMVSGQGYGKLIPIQEVMRSDKSKIINLAQGDYVAGAVPIYEEKPNGMIFMRTKSLLYYNKAENFPVLKRMAQGNKVMKPKTPIEDIYYVPMTNADCVMVYTEYGCFKLMAAESLIIKSRPQAVDLMGKSILGVVPVNSDKTKVTLFDASGTSKFMITVDKMVHLIPEHGDPQKFRVGNAISTPVKVLKKSRNEYYHLMVSEKL